MRLLWLLALPLLACKKEAPPKPLAAPPLAPLEQKVDGAYHAVACGAVTAVWSGTDEHLKDLPGQPPPKRYGVESLAFKFADGTQKHFAPTGQLFFDDWHFEIFAPDCSAVALPIDHYGPYHLVKTADLRGYLEGRIKPVVVQALNEKDALVHSNGRWASPGVWEFTASCCGGAQVFRAALKDQGSLERVFSADAAPHGLKRVGETYEVAP
jgi:hypothetical protein